MGILSLIIAAPARNDTAVDRAPVESRAALVEAMRDKKEQQVQLADEPTERRGLPHLIVSNAAKLAGGTRGLRVRFGGLPARSGLAMRFEYARRDLAEGSAAVSASIGGSARGFAVAGASIAFPRLLRDKAVLEFSAAHRHLPSLDYYGPGPGSNKADRSDYLLEDTSLAFTTTFEVARRFTVGTFGRVLFINVGPGRDAEFASTDQIFTPATTPGLRQQTDYLAAGLFAAFDTRDFPGGASSGGLYSARYSRYSDRDLRRHSFHQLDLEAQRFIPLLHATRVIALRGATTLTDSGTGQTVPFYLQPSIGGPRSLRGFRAYRFYGENSMVMNAEYRLEVVRGLDFALFTDAGKVFPKWGDLNFAELKASYGFGFRVRTRDNVMLRFDTGFSSEGFQTWLTFEDIL